MPPGCEYRIQMWGMCQNGWMRRISRTFMDKELLPRLTHMSDDDTLIHVCN